MRESRCVNHWRKGEVVGKMYVRPDMYQPDAENVVTDMEWRRDPSGLDER